MTKSICLFICLLALLPQAAFAGTQRSESRPNILFIAVDDMKPMTGWYGDDTVKTPAFDRLASASTVFTAAYTQYPVCGPSRASLLTGLRPEVSGVMDLKTRMRDIHPDILTLPQFFKNHGYQTAASGKVFDPRNVDSRDDDDPVSWTIPYSQSMPEADRKLAVNYAVRAIEAPSERFIDGAINARGISLMREMAADPRPFFLAVGYKKPHLPFAAPKRFFDLYDRASFGLEAWQAAPEGSDASYILMDNNEMRSYVPSPGPDGEQGEYSADGMTPGQQRELIHGYHAAVSFIDSLLAELLKELEVTGQADNTIIVLWGDHGFHLGDHGMWGKHTTMEQANRVPMMIHVPGEKGGYASTLVELMDLFPTLAGLTGLEAPANLQGKDLAPVLDDPGLDLGDVAISMYGAKVPTATQCAHNVSLYRVGKPGRQGGLRDLYDIRKTPMKRAI